MKKFFVILFAFVAFNAFAQDYKNFDYVFKRGSFDATLFERGLTGKYSLPSDKVELLKTLIQNGHVTIYPNQNKVIWYIDTIRSIMSKEGGKEAMEILATIITVFCGNFKGNYLYWSEGYLTNDKLFYEHSDSWKKFDLYQVW